MRAKIIQAWPDLIPFGTVQTLTFETSVSTVKGRYLMNTLLVPLQVIFGTKPFLFSSTISL